ncbi:MAG: hypothetical protein A2X13_14535 [Bacteroidetes bacterium GWC2_33_15]|nr:MAG: hypothetical protein A2X10_12580 [Bacteroidetes bacterium GWA2_33_15]OFX50089.1 MAG: hypothetical protein A2X13_14535 [Bacteroidetes bacterium GWC2_33_15]OFX65242.1 MAG: hypothetical protein A2X15_04110 [Bacteroidetes bacterium GWB2_32_14]OFX70468.1 MAG: hypothetical protein A2X14_04165 [Bacteroidetes bacterium GWD2_33_33]HAN19659.1 hypothetical protein [Bacteroidales bacterium]
MTFNQRVIRFRNYKKLSQKDFAEGLGVTRQTISNIENDKNTASWDFMYKVLNKFPEINVKWFVLGEGEMLECENNIASEPAARYGKEDLKEKLISTLERENELLRQEIERLKQDGCEQKTNTG